MPGTVDFKRVLAFGDCLICKDELSGKPALAHEGVKCEPCHEDCLKTWVKVKNICPKCHATVDMNSLFSWKERAITELKLMAKDALVGAIIGSSMLGLIAGTGGRVGLVEALTIGGLAISGVTVAGETGAAALATAGAGAAAAAGVGVKVEEGVVFRIVVASALTIGAGLVLGLRGREAVSTVARGVAGFVGIIATESVVVKGTVGPAVVVGAVAGGAVGAVALGIIKRRHLAWE